jgi:uncharacterized peroxidase-related enzyme
LPITAIEKLNSEGSVLQIDEERLQRNPERRGSAAANLTVVEEATAGEDVLALYQEFRSRFGRPDIPGIAKCFATNPFMLKSMIDLAAGFLFVEGHLTRRHKEMIATLISLQNDCAYCANSHGSLLLAQGGSAEVLCALEAGSLDSDCFTQKEQALLHFALKVNAESQSITRAEVEKTMQADWTEAQLTEAVHLAALFAAFNRIANAFGIPAPHLSHP